MRCKTHAFTSWYAGFHLQKPLVSQGKTMGFTTFFSDFSGAESVIFTLYNTHKHSLTPLSKNLNSLKMLINSHLLTVDTRLIGQPKIRKQSQWQSQLQ